MADHPRPRTDPQTAGQPETRLTNLELLFMHLERQLGDLNQIVLDQGQQIEGLRRELARQPSQAEQPDETDVNEASDL